MQVSLINGQFTATEAINIITQMIQVKIRFHEDKIQPGSSQEDIKMREKKIKFLQHELAGLREYIRNNPEKINLKAEIQVESESPVNA